MTHYVDVHRSYDLLVRRVQKTFSRDDTGIVDEYRYLWNIANNIDDYGNRNKLIFFFFIMKWYFVRLSRETRLVLSVSRSRRPCISNILH